jgi:hypothetical protein
LHRVVEVPETDLARALEKLASAKFIYEQALYPQAEYVFKHALTPEVAYHSVLTERRKTLHERAAEAIETLFAASLEAHYGRAQAGHGALRRREALDGSRRHTFPDGDTRNEPEGDPITSSSRRSDGF